MRPYQNGTPVWRSRRSVPAYTLASAAQAAPVQNNASPTFTFTESCGQFSATDLGTVVTLSVQLIVTDAAGNTVTIQSGSGGQPALTLRLFNCGIR